MNVDQLLGLLIKWAALTAGFLAAATLIPKFDLKSVKSGIWVAALYALVNVVLGKLLAAFFGVATLGIACVFGSLSTFLVSFALIKIVDALTDLLEVEGLFPAALGAIVLSIVSAITEGVLSQIF